MAKFMVFAGSDCYPRGGMADFVGVADDIHEIRVILDRVDTHLRETTSSGVEWAHVLNSDTGDPHELIGWPSAGHGQAFLFSEIGSTTDG